MEGSIKTDEIPEYWNAAYQANLASCRPISGRAASRMCTGAMEVWYFSTYSTGSLYAAQFYAAMDAEMRGLENSIESADFKSVRGWLSQKIIGLEGSLRAKKFVIKQAENRYKLSILRSI
jgi:carboxypeptidase Taq